MQLNLYHIKNLTDKALTKIRNNIHDEEGMELSQKILEINTEFYTMWNYRRDTLKKFTEEKSPEEAINLLKRELTILETAVQHSAKSYWIWHHRMLICMWLDKFNGSVDWKREVGLCTKFLKLDNRNFHCWTYRRFVTKKAGLSDNEEFVYTTQKIEENFSNYSAWHQRSLLLPKIHTTPESLEEAIKQELNLVHQAFFTEPEDQSAWIYLRWLLGIIKPTKEVIEKEIETCNELLDLEPNSKWTLLTKVILLKLGGHNEQATGLVAKLKQVDPVHFNYYVDWEKKMVIV